VAIATFSVVSIHLADSSLDALLFAAVSSVFIAILPVGYIAWLVSRERIQGGIDLQYRQERQAPYLIAAASSGVGDAALWAVGAPGLMVVLATLYSAIAVVMAIINRRWKISAHAAGAGIGLGAMVSSFGAAALPLAILLPAVCWARVRIDMHSRAQVIAGATLGTLTGLAPLAMHGLR
jgi:membrane-associated phospholipid phosphatase